MNLICNQTPDRVKLIFYDLKAKNIAVIDGLTFRVLGGTGSLVLGIVTFVSGGHFLIVIYGNRK
jgi:hypothetical protein